METEAYTIYSLDTNLSEKHVAAACSDNVVRLFNINGSNLDPVADLQGHSGPVTRASFVNHGELLVSSDFTGKIILWKLEGGVFANKFEKQVYDGPIYDTAVRYSRNGMTIYCGCDGGLLRILQLDTSYSATESSVECHRYSISSVSCNEKYLLTGGMDFSIALHGSDDDAPVYFKNHQGPVTTVSIAPSNHTGSLSFASCGEDSKLFIYQKIGEQYTPQEILLDETGHSLSWSRTGFVLTVGYGADQFKSFILGASGEYEEVEMRGESD